MSNLIGKLDDSDVSTIFKVCRNLKDTNVPPFLLSHLILYSILIDQSNFIDDCVVEILAVLNDVGNMTDSPCPGLDDDLLTEISSIDQEKRQMCTQV